MRGIRFRTRLLLSFWMILILALCLPTYYISQTLKIDIIREATANAFTELNFVGWLLEKAPEFENTQALDAWCKEMGNQVKYRITVIAAGGRVIADSEVAGRRIPELDNHADREEVIGARKLGQATSIRYSETLKKNLIYAAKNINSEIAPSGVLRVAIPLSTIEARLAHFSRQFWWILMAIFAGATLLSLILAQRLESPIRKIIRAAMAIGEGDYARRLDLDIEINPGTEFAPLARSINDMAAKIGQNIDMITAQKQELEAVLEGMQEGVMLLDRDGRIKAVNQALTGIARCLPSCVGHRPMEVFLDTEIQAACDQILSEKEHMRLKAAMRNDRVYEVNLVKIPEDGAVVVFHDISELVRLEKVRQDFVANVSHELRTPLTSIKGYAETLQNPSFRAGD
ncbi:MAG: histidine kinase dimerization/phospho-acceptor domain-containing protein, partial [Desulfosalsimonadaceae bacterium]